MFARLKAAIQDEIEEQPEEEERAVNKKRTEEKTL